MRWSCAMLPRLGSGTEVVLKLQRGKEVKLAALELQLRLIRLALELVAVTDAAAGDLQAMQRACRAGGDHWRVMARDFEVRAIAAARALARSLVAHLNVLGDKPHATLPKIGKGELQCCKEPCWPCSCV